MTVAAIACAACSCSASSCIGGSLRATSTRSKPSRAKSFANSTPKPLDAPVINAVRRSLMELPYPRGYSERAAFPERLDAATSAIP